MLLVRASGQYFSVQAGLRNVGRLCRGESWPVLPLVLFSVVVVIIPLAHAGPPDPTWIPGIYDNADYDDVVGFVTDGPVASGGQWPARVADGPRRYQVLLDPGQKASEIVYVEMNRGPPVAILCSSRLHTDRRQDELVSPFASPAIPFQSRDRRTLRTRDSAATAPIGNALGGWSPGGRAGPQGIRGFA
jgi:hypothetical protein